MLNFFKSSILLLAVTVLSIALLIGACSQSDNILDNEEDSDNECSSWYRPADQPVFTTEYGNNHDAILFVEPELEHFYHLIVSHKKSGAHFWRTKDFSWNSASWELVSDQYNIGGHYEYDDGIKVDDT